MKPHQFNITSNTDHILLLSEKVCDIFEDRGMPPAEAIHVRIAMVEALNNIAEHAYQGIPNQDIELKFVLETRMLTLEIYDWGAINPKAAQPKDISIDASAPAALPEGGFGYHIIQDVMDQVCYSRTNNKNKLLLVKKW